MFGFGKSKNLIYTNVPAADPIPLVAYYDEFLWYYPDCEPETKSWFNENTKSDWHIIDCGANIGYFSILFSRLASQGQVYAVEPTSTVEMLRKNIRHNKCKNISVHQIAMGDKSGKHEDAIYRIWGQEAEQQTYEFRTVDEFVGEQGIGRLDCIKIDVDSYDFEVLRGAEKTLEKFNPFVVVELNHALNKRGQNNAEALAWLACHGYEEALCLDYDNFILRKGYTPAEQPTINIHFPG